MSELLSMADYAVDLHGETKVEQASGVFRGIRNNAMNFSGFPLLSCAVALFFTVAHSMPASATEPLTESEVAALYTQLDKARSVESALSVREQCYVDHDGSLQQQSERDQVEAGNYRRQREQLSAQLAEAQSQADGFRQQHQVVQIQYQALQPMLNLTETELNRAFERYRKCQRDWGFLCAIGDELGGQRIKRERLVVAKKQLQLVVGSLQSALSAAEARVQQSKAQLDNTTSEINRREARIGELDREIATIKASLSTIRTVKPNYSNHIHQFSSSFTEFEGLDPNSDRRFVISRLRSESDALKGLLEKAEALLNENGLLLANGERICTTNH